MGFRIEEQSYLNPIADIWSIKIRDKDCPLLNTTGIGITKQHALKNALLEFLEHLVTHYFWSDIYLGKTIAKNQYMHFSQEEWFKSEQQNTWPKKVLNTELQEFYNPLRELNANSLIDVSSSNQERGLCCIPYENLRTNKAVYFPVNLVHNLYASNGISSGSSIIEARNNALCQILQNHIQSRVIAEGIALPNIPSAIINQHQQLASTIRNIEDSRYSILIKDASLNGMFPVVLVILLDTHEQSICMSFGANPDMGLALEHATTTLFKYHTTNQTHRLIEPGFDMDEISSPNNLAQQFQHSTGITAWQSLNDKSEYAFFDWSQKFSKVKLTETYEQLSKIIELNGNDIFVFEVNHADMHICRMLVPGLSEIYPVDDLIWENNNAGNKVRDNILKKNKSINECEQLIEDLEDLDLDDNFLISKLIGMPADTTNIFHDLCVAELILLLALKTQDNERIQEGCEWVLHYKKINQRRLKTYKCINIILQLDKMTDYATVLKQLFTQQILNDALALIDGEDVFSLDSQWQTHKLMIKAYKKALDNIN